MLQARAYLSFEADGVNLRDNYVAILTEAARHLEQGVSPSRYEFATSEPPCLHPTCVHAATTLDIEMALLRGISGHHVHPAPLCSI
eukprot:scaffold184949_cov31-Tisochrysis_lutea.AAC.2